MLLSLGVMAVLAASLAPAALASSPGHGPKPPDAPGRKYNQPPPAPGADSLWGLGVANSALDPNGLEEAMGRTFEAQGVYSKLTGEAYPSPYALNAEKDGARIYLNINSWHLVGTTKVCYPYKNYASHNYDAYLQNWVNALQAFDYDDTFITLNHEPTAHRAEQPSCGNAGEYVQAYDYVFHYMRNHGITYPFVWWMTASAFQKPEFARTWQPPAGDFSVIAIDGYNRFLGGVWRSPEFIFEDSETYAESLGKPLVIGEVGTLEDHARPGRKADWITTAAQLFRVWGVDAILWNDTNGNEPNTSTSAMAAWINASEGAGAAFLQNASGQPGSTVSTWGGGFSANETVEVRANSVSGPILGTKVADGGGGVNPISLHIPTPFAGGDHDLLAIGRSSGTIAHATLSVSPPESEPFSIAAGHVYTYEGRGFVPGELVEVWFPGGPHHSQTASVNGSVSIAAASPPEPHEGGEVTVSAPSASLTFPFHVIPVMVVPGEGQPQQSVPVSITGYGANENVTVKFGSTVLTTLTTNAWGSASDDVVLDSTFGRFTLLVTGNSSHVSKQTSILLSTTISLSPDTGPTGTTVEVTSGPGWKPGESVTVKMGSHVVGTVTADSNGVVDTTVVIDKNTPGIIHVSLTGHLLKLTATGEFTVT
jgi:hypothetical protein